MAGLFQNWWTSALEIPGYTNSLIGCLKYLEEQVSSLHRRLPWKDKSQEPGELLNKSGTLSVFSTAM